MITFKMPFNALPAGSFSSDIVYVQDETYKAYLVIWEHYSPKKFYVIYRLGNVSVICDKFATESEAMECLSKCMKLAMRGKLIYRHCSCGEKCYYGETCPTPCIRPFYSQWYREKIENIPKHMWFWKANEH